ncbi:MAG: hypothetical protein JWO83_2032 [Caulobacteraceae bacterium]|jgi:hypothetical protein|nr:hypothetical protein [Caulobacteraceae bacterium]
MPEPGMNVSIRNIIVEDMKWARLAQPVPARNIRDDAGKVRRSQLREERIVSGRPA